MTCLLLLLHLLLATFLAGVRAAGADSAPCTTGSPTTTAGYVINYSKATPTQFAAGAGYEPDHAWSSSHVLGTYVSACSFCFPSLSLSLLSTLVQGNQRLTKTLPSARQQTYDVPAPLETGFALAQFKCQFKCNSFDSASFFVEYGECAASLYPVPGPLGRTGAKRFWLTAHSS